MDVEQRSAHGRVWAGRAARAALGVSLALLLLELGSGEPFHAPARGLPLAPLCAGVLASALASALLGHKRRAPPLAPLCAVLGVLLVGLVGLVRVRGPVGLSALAASDGGGEARLAPSHIDLLPRDLDRLPAARKRTLIWDGPLRTPRRGPYALRLEVQGRASLELDGRPLLHAEDATAEVLEPLLAGEHHLRVVATGRVLRVRLCWTRPTRDGAPGRYGEIVPARFLGESRSPSLWLAGDVLCFLVAGLFGVLAYLVPWDRPRELGDPVAPGPREIGLSALAHAGLALALTWPLISDPASLGPWLRPDGRLNAWILGWNAHALFAEPGRVFQAPVFHPLPDALTFTENLLLPGLLAAPFTRAWGPAAGYNAVFLLSLVLGALGAQVLARRACGDPLAAWAAGALFGFGAWRFANWAHLHAHATLFFPWGFVALERFLDRRTLARAAALGACLALQALSSIYLGAIQGVAVAVWSLPGLVRPFDLRALLRLAAGTGLCLALVAPVFRPYFRMRVFQGVEFTLEDVRAYATTLESYVAAYTGPWAPLGERHLPAERVREPLFPGLVTLALGLVGLASAPRRFRLPLVWAAAVALVLSLGPETPVYRLLHEHFVPLRALRALGRFALVPLLCLAVWAACALAGRRRTWVLGALALALAENAQWPAPLEPLKQPGSVAAWLARGTGAVVVLPLGENDTQVMLDGLTHRRPLLNGDSGFVPRPYARLAETLGDATWSERLRLLRALRVTHVVARDELPLPVAARFDGERIYTLPPGPAAQAVQGGEPVRLAGAAGAPRLDLGRARLLSTLDFELSDGPWLFRPRVQVSLDGESWRTVIAEASLADATLALYRDPRRGRGRLRLHVEARHVILPERLPLRGEAVFLTFGGEQPPDPPGHLAQRRAAGLLEQAHSLRERVAPTGAGSEARRLRSAARAAAGRARPSAAPAVNGLSEESAEGLDVLRGSSLPRRSRAASRSMGRASPRSAS